MVCCSFVVGSGCSRFLEEENQAEYLSPGYREYIFLFLMKGEEVASASDLVLLQLNSTYGFCGLDRRHPHSDPTSAIHCH